MNNFGNVDTLHITIQNIRINKYRFLEIYTLFGWSPPDWFPIDLGHLRARPADDPKLIWLATPTLNHPTKNPHTQYGVKNMVYLWVFRLNERIEAPFGHRDGPNFSRIPLRAKVNARLLSPMVAREKGNSMYYVFCVLKDERTLPRMCVCVFVWDWALLVVYVV